MSSKRSSSNVVASGVSRKILGVIAVASIAAAAFLVLRSRSSLPLPGSQVYEQVTRAFYRGLAQLEVGLLDDAKREFTAVTMQAAEEPAGWANLGLAHLRLGELDAAAAPIERALSLAPRNAEVELLAGRMEIARGRLDEGVRHLRRAVELDPKALLPRFALAEEVERAAAADADAQALALLDELVMLAPQNIAVLVERARVAAKTRDVQRLKESISALQPMAASWPAAAWAKFQALQEAVAANDVVTAQRTTAFLRNVLARVPAFGEDLSAIRTPTELIAEPFEGFVAMSAPSPSPSAIDAGLAYTTERIAADVTGPPVAVSLDGQGSYGVFVFDRGMLRRLDVPQAAQISDRLGADGRLLAFDADNDFRTDILAVSDGLDLLRQEDAGRFSNVAPTPQALCGCRSAWAADIEMDGDLDVVSADGAGDSFVLRNKGDGTWEMWKPFAGVSGATAFAWADVDGDADPDAVFVDGAGDVHLFLNQQAGTFAHSTVPDLRNVVALGAADLDADGQFELVVLDGSGALRRATWSPSTWTVAEIAAWDGLNRAQVGTHRLLFGDLDNNGAVDVVAAGAGESRIWLMDERLRLTPLQATPEGEAYAIADLNNDGHLDLVASVAGGVVRHLGRGGGNYHWKQIRPRAQAQAGDQRINSFGSGGYIEARAGLLFQKQLLTGGPVHIGLGAHSSLDVARIVWPNGVAQAEFGTGVDDTLVAEQRLKGSCPWVFAWDGSRMKFVTDFLWRSPLGLRINAQDTAGVTQTEDWVRLRGDQLLPHNGIYDIRITGELWETHFFDYASLMVVDHSADTEVVVDERFSPASPPALKVHVLSRVRPLTRAWDSDGEDVTNVVRAVDGQYLSTFKRGRYQGIAEDHFVEFEPGVVNVNSVLVASGWIYPTDSSINVAIAQAGIAPRGLALEAQNGDGSWRTVNADLGFPAGKNKTMLIDLSGARGAQRLRLRSNLEIYWDALQLAEPASAPPRTTRLQASAAELRYRGFSATDSPRGDAPETPHYDRLVSTSPRWRDLSGYHTRFGDVSELVEQVDDRYVIMNAGDELRLTFREAPGPPAGWRRDYVLIGDGWEKDGDYNTGFSQTVLPLPSHDHPAYGNATTSLTLEDDPVYQRHAEDWQRYHTRYVAPQRFLRGLARRTAP